MPAQDVVAAHDHDGEQQQREQVEQRLRDERAGHDRERLPHAAQPPRHDQGTRRLTEPRRQRRGHQDADGGRAQDRPSLDGRLRQRGSQDLEPRHRAQEHRGREQPERNQHPDRARVHERRDDVVDPHTLQRQEGEEETDDRGDRERHPACAGQETGSPRALRDGARLERRQPACAPARRQVALHEARLGAHRLHSAGRLWRLDRTLVHRGHLLRHLGPGEVRGPRPRRGTHLPPAGGVDRQRTQRLGQCEGVARRHQQPVAAVGHHLAVAGDLGGDHRGAGRERLRQDHAEALAAQRGSTQHVGAVQAPPKLLVVHASERLDAVHAALDLGQQGLDALGVGADHLEARRDVLAQAGERRQQHGQALALLLAADEHDPQIVVDRLRPARRGVEVDAVRDDVVRAAEETLARPARGLRNGDPRMQPVEDPARADRARDRVREPAGGVDVEGPDHRRAGVEACTRPSRAWARSARARGSRRSRLRAAHGAGATRPPDSPTAATSPRSSAARPCGRAAPRSRAAEPDPAHAGAAAV